MCYEDENNCNSIGTKHNSLSLNELISNNFEVNYNIKDEVHDLMSKSIYLWKTRPIPYKLNYYAGCDVLYLPKIYDLIVQKFEQKILKKITLNDIFKECKKYLQYLNMNKNIKNYNKMNLTKGTKIKGLIKNIQHHCIYVQLNIGYIGIVDNFSTVQIMSEIYKLGDIVDFTILDIENKRKRMKLDVVEIDKKNDNKENEDEKNNDIDNKYFTNPENININLNEHSDINPLIQGLNINKERFFPKSYIQNLKNGSNYNYVRDVEVSQRGSRRAAPGRRSRTHRPLDTGLPGGRPRAPAVSAAAGSPGLARRRGRAPGRQGRRAQAGSPGASLMLCVRQCDVPV